MVEKDAEGNPIRPLHLTPEQLRRAYLQPAMNERLANAARTRLAMLRKEQAQKRELHVVGEEYDAG